MANVRKGESTEVGLFQSYVGVGVGVLIRK